MDNIKINTCRICLVSPGDVSITEKTATMAYIDIMKMIINLEVNDYNDFYNMICLCCANKLENVYKLKLQILESDDILNQLFVLKIDPPFLENDLKLECYEEQYIAYNNDKENESSNQEDAEHDDDFIVEDNINDLNDSDEEQVEVKEHKLRRKRKIKEQKTNKVKKSRIKLPSDEKFRYECDVCHKKFTRSETVKNHKRIHTGERPFDCKLCDKKFSQKSNFTAHLKTHSEEKLFVCEICSKQFKTKFYLQHHSYTHMPSSEKKFKCDKCPQAFFEAIKLKYHQEIHIGERKYACSDCGKGFISKRYLNQHYRTVHLAIKNHECAVCGKTFSNNSNLISHFRIHTGEKPFECKYCDAKFNQSTPLVRHTEAHLNRGDIMRTEQVRAATNDLSFQQSL